MLLFLLIFCSYYVLLSCVDIDNAKYESSLLRKHQQNLLEVEDLLRDLEQKIKVLSLLLEADFKNDARREEFVYENMTNGLKNEAFAKDQNNKAENLTNLPTEYVFRQSPNYDTIESYPGVSRNIPGSYAPPVKSHQLSPGQIRHVALKHSDLRGLPSVRHLLKPKYPNFPESKISPSLLMDKIPGYTHKFSYTPNFSRPWLEEERALRYIVSQLPSTAERKPPVQMANTPTLHYTPRFPSIPKTYRHWSKRRVTSKKPPEKDHFDHIGPHEFMLFRPLFDVGLSNPLNYPQNYPENLKSHPPDSTLTTTIKTTTIGHHAKIWLQELAPYTRRRRKKKRSSKDQGRPTVSMSAKMPEPTNYLMSEAATMVQLFKKDVDVGKPALIQQDPHKNWMRTTKVVLHETTKEQKASTTLSPNQRYLELMKQLGEGYLMVFIMELCRLIAVKDRRDVRDILAPVERIYNTWLESGRLSWLNDPLRTAIGKLTVMASENNNTDTVRNVSSVMFHTLLERKTLLSPEQSSMIQLAESFYDEAGGRRLLCALKQFEEYPNTTKPSYQICEGLIESLLQPFIPPADTVSRGQLLSSVSSMLQQRVPHLFEDKKTEDSCEGMRNGRGKPMIAPRKRKRKRKHHHHHHHKKKRKRHLEPEYYKLQ